MFSVYFPFHLHFIVYFYSLGSKNDEWSTAGRKRKQTTKVQQQRPSHVENGEDQHNHQDNSNSGSSSNRVFYEQRGRGGGRGRRAQRGGLFCCNRSCDWI